MYIDDVSLKYDSEITYDIDDTTLADLTIDGAIITGFLPDKINYDIELGAGTTVVPTVAATTNNTSATAAIRLQQVSQEQQQFLLLLKMEQLLILFLSISAYQH